LLVLAVRLALDRLAFGFDLRAAEGGELGERLVLGGVARGTFVGGAGRVADEEQRGGALRWIREPSGRADAGSWSSSSSSRLRGSGSAGCGWCATSATGVRDAGAQHQACGEDDATSPGRRWSR